MQRIAFASGRGSDCRQFCRVGSRHGSDACGSGRIRVQKVTRVHLWLE